MRNNLAKIVDSNASETFVVSKELFGYIRVVGALQVELGYGSTVAARHKEVVSVDLEHIILKLSSVSYTPGLTMNTLSCSRLSEPRIATLIAKDYCTIIDRRKHGTVKVEIPRKETDGLYVARIGSAQTLALKAIDEDNPSFNLCLRRMGPADKNVIQKC